MKGLAYLLIAAMLMAGCATSNQSINQRLDRIEEKQERITVTLRRILAMLSDLQSKK